MRVFVKNLRNQPLMPCSTSKARILLKEGKAKIQSYNPFSIQLTIPTGETVQPVGIGVDSGAKYIGIAIASEDKVLATAEITPFDLELFNKSMFDDNSFEKIRRKDKRPRYEKKKIKELVSLKKVKTDLNQDIILKKQF